jgi:hypothetical protein
MGSRLPESKQNTGGDRRLAVFQLWICSAFEQFGNGNHSAD